MGDLILGVLLQYLVSASLIISLMVGKWSSHGRLGHNVHLHVPNI